MAESNWDEAVRVWGPTVFAGRSKVLAIPDRFEHMHPELVAELERQYESIQADVSGEG